MGDVLYEKRSQVERRWWLLSILPSVLIMVIVIYQSAWLSPAGWQFTLMDDPMISMTYARTLVDTGELVWFPGAPRVEGYTNPGWVLLMAALHWIGLPSGSISFFVMVLGACSVVAIGIASREIAKEIATPATTRLTDWLVPLSVTLCFPLLWYAVRGWEAGFLTALAVVLVCIVARWSDSKRVSLSRLFFVSAALSLGILIRLDFWVMALVIILYVAVLQVGTRRRLQVLVTLSAVPALLTVLLSGWRHLYYGRLVPNTYELKVGGYSILERLERGLGSDIKLLPLLLGALVGALLLLQIKPSGNHRKIFLLVAMTVAPVVYSTYVGGWTDESMPSPLVLPTLVFASVLWLTGVVRFLTDVPLHGAVQSRWIFAFAIAEFLSVLAWARGFDSYGEAIQLVTIFMIAFLVLGLAILTTRGSRGLRSPSGGHPKSPNVISGAVAALVLCLLFSAGTSSWTWLTKGVNSVAGDKDWADIGLAFNKEVLPGGSIAVTGAGQIIYYSERAGVDLVGKSDRFIAESAPVGPYWPGHSKWNWDYSINLEPDVIQSTFFPPLTADDYRNLSMNGYEWRCLKYGTTGVLLPILVKIESPYVAETLLSSLCPDRKVDPLSTSSQNTSG